MATIPNPEPPLPGYMGLPALSGQNYTPQQHWRWVLRKLGGGVRDVELTSEGDVDPLTSEPFPPGETHESDCMAEAARWFLFRWGWTKVIQVALAHGQSEYVLPPEVIDVIDLTLPSFQLPSLDADQFSYTYFSLLFGQWTNPNVAPMPYSDLVQRLQYLEEIGRIFSTDREWNYDKRTRTLQIMPPPNSIGGLTASDGRPLGMSALVTIWSTELDTRQLDPMETDLFRRRLLAEAMIVLGNIRSKEDSLPSLGGDRSLNGVDLKGEAETIMDKLEQDVLNWKRSVPLISG